MLKTVFKVLFALLALWLVNTILLALYSPCGVWIRREVREEPLKAPIKVTSIDGLRLTTPNGNYIIGGVSLPASIKHQKLLERFLRVATAQGIEIIEPGDFANAHTIRCEPRVWHCCGCDPVAAHFEQHNLTELLVCLGFADMSKEARLSQTKAALRLRAAEYYRLKFDSKRSLEECFSDKYGIDICAAMRVSNSIATGLAFINRSSAPTTDSKP